MSGARYHLTSRLESGELSDLFLAQRDAQPVQLRLFHPRSSDPVYAQALLAAAGALRGVEGPCLVRTTDVGMVAGRLGVVQEPVDGLTLANALLRLGGKNVVLGHALGIGFLLQICDALAAAHKAGVVHGALGPAAVWLTRAGVARVADFGAGVALHASVSLKPFAVRTRGPFGAPELLTGEPPSVAADIYSLGAVAYLLLTQEPPPAPKPARREPVLPPSRVNRRLNARIDPIVMRAMDPHPARRFAGALEFASALRGFLAELGGLPGAEEAARFVQELAPSGASALVPGGLPFMEPFPLTQLTGPPLAPAQAAAPRHDLEEHDTQEAAPAFETFKPQARPPPDEADGLKTLAGPGELKTAPGQADPPASPWDAPPSLAPVVASPRNTAEGASLGHRIPKERLRSVDGSQDEENSAAKKVRRPGTDPAGKKLRRPASTKLKPSLSEVLAADAGVDEYALERERAAEERKRQEEVAAKLKARAYEGRSRTAFVAVGILGTALLALSAFLLWPSQADLATDQLGPGAPPPPQPLVVGTKGSDQDHTPAGSTAGFLSVKSDQPAAVFIDGLRVRKELPLSKYPVEPGVRKIAVESLVTGLRKERSVTFTKGGSFLVEERFGDGR